MSKVEIRPLAAIDRPALESALRSDDTFRAEEVAVALELIDDALARPGVDYHVRVALLDPAAGAAGLPRLADGGACVAGYICYGPTPMTDATWDLYWIVTHAAARGRGVARALVEAMEEVLRRRGARSVRVETSVLESYGAAREFYRRLGYPEAARLSDFYQRGDDLIIYYKAL
jgi:ribosomal protein S18 acetylase RimI-like enzyme